MPDRDWFHRAVVYQIYPRSFADASGDGIGDLAGIISRLDYLESLGVDVLWLSPVYCSPQDDNGYDISDYRNIDPTFGTLALFDELLDEAHRRNLKLVMDLVVNHTSDEHPWFIESRSGPDSAKRDWYWWRPPRAGYAAGTAGAEPNNWGSFFSGPAWEYDPASGQYYLHLFSRKQPDLNWENPAVRAAVYEMMRWWLDRGVDGFRMDVINMISKVPHLPDGPLRDGQVFGDLGPFVLCGPRNHEFLQEMHREAFAGRAAELLTVGEMPGVGVDQARLFTDAARHEMDMVFQFEHVNIDHAGSKWNVKEFDLRALKDTFGRWQHALADVGWNSLYWNNHDQPRVVSRFGDDGAHREDSAKMLGTILHLHRGTPFIYQGEELAMTNAPLTTIDDYQDIEALNHYRAALAAGGDPYDILASMAQMSRDNARTPMQWDDSVHGGFTRGTPWMQVNPNSATINARAAQADPESVFHHYRRLIELRHHERVVAEGDFHLLAPDDPHVYAFIRSLPDVELLVVGNFSADPRPVPIEDAASWADATVIIATGPAPPPDADRREALTLGPWASRVYRRRR